MASTTASRCCGRAATREEARAPKLREARSCPAEPRQSDGHGASSSVPALAGRGAGSQPLRRAPTRAPRRPRKLRRIGGRPRRETGRPGGRAAAAPRAVGRRREDGVFPLVERGLVARRLRPPPRCSTPAPPPRSARGSGGSRYEGMPSTHAASGCGGGVRSARPRRTAVRRLLRRRPQSANACASRDQFCRKAGIPVT